MRSRGVWSRGRSSSDTGLSLVELLVSMMLLGLILAMLTGLYLSATRSVSFGQSMDSSTRVASNAANELSQVMRFATTLKVTGVTAASPAFVAAGRESVTFYSNVDVNAMTSVALLPARPTRVMFAIDPTSRALIESRWTATAAGTAWVFAGTASTANSILNLGASYVAPGAGAPLFKYFDTSGVAIATPAAGSMPAADLARIGSVLLTISVQGTSGSSAGPVIVENTVVLPNLVAVSP